VRGVDDYALPWMTVALHHAPRFILIRPSPPTPLHEGEGSSGVAFMAGVGAGVAWMGDCGILDPMMTRTDSPSPEPGVAQDAFGHGVYDAGKAVRVVDFPRDVTPVRQVQEFH